MSASTPLAAAPPNTRANSFSISPLELPLPCFQEAATQTSKVATAALKTTEAPSE